MKVITFNGSARHDGNTAILIKHVFAELKKANIEIDWGKNPAWLYGLYPMLPIEESTVFGYDR